VKIPFFSKSKTVPEKKTHVYNIAADSFLAFAFGSQGWISASQAMSLYRQTSAIATAVDMIASAIKQINPVIQTSDGKFLDTHPIIDLLKKPNGFEDWQQFCENVSIYYLLKHDSVVLGSGNIKYSPAELWAVSLQELSILQGDDQYPSAYMVTNGVLKGRYEKRRVDGEFRFYDGSLKELYHIKGFASRPVKTEADSPLQAAAMEAKQIIKGKYHNVKLLENGGRLSLLVTFNDDDFINDDEHNKRVMRLNEQYSGPNNAGRIGVISGADIQHIKEFGKSNKDMDFAKLEEMAGNAIYLRYQIPLSLVTTDSATFDNVKTGVEMFYDNAVLPNANVVFSGLSRMLLPRFGMDPSRESITYNPESIEPLKARMLEEVSKRKKNEIETINELRSLLPSRGPITNGDTVYIRSNVVPVGDDQDTSDNNDT